MEEGEMAEEKAYLEDQPLKRYLRKKNQPLKRYLRKLQKNRKVGWKRVRWLKKKHIWRRMLAVRLLRKKFRKKMKLLRKLKRLWRLKQVKKRIWKLKKRCALWRSHLFQN